jgi:crotonobetainyl-CoA:carnitine CoA-transferase CaiB-like acyl-CoA transferase
VPAGPVNDLPTALADPQTAARDVLVDVEHPNLGTVRHIASPMRVDGEPAPIRRAPMRGEHSDEILREVCGYGPERIDALAGSGVVPRR